MGEISSTERDAETRAFEVLHAHILHAFPDLVAELGGNPEEMLAEAGLDAASIAGGRAHYGRVVMLLEHAANALGCPDFGLRLAVRQGAGAISGPLGTVMRNSATFGEAVAYAQSHTHAHSLAVRIHIERRRDSRDIFVGHDILVEGMLNRRQSIEQALLLGHLNAVEITGGRARAREVLFRHRPLSALKTYDRYFGCPVRFDQQQDGVIFSEEDLLCPIVSRDATLWQSTAAMIDTAFAGACTPMHAQVRGVILQLLGAESCSNERVAAELHLHPRTLHRRLKEEGASFQGVKDAVRRDMALYYLQHTDLDLAEIAQRLCYAEHSVFTRSCVRWFMAPPSEVRERGKRQVSIN